ncbi:MAG TPA: DUF4157 domain-containing protein, partial [Thermoanaerobaculia bacterium]|nr:DUF4157 domain-containing protein [Thermoanaerobaculia bacterium]
MKASVGPQQSEHAEAAPSPAPQVVTPAQRLQRTAGNFAIQQFVQTKLRAGSPGDPLEREADRVADEVVGNDPAADMARIFGRDFSSVRMHTGESDAERARSLGARAFTLGNDIVFGRGEYQPGTKEGQRLIAHELTHVVQQSRGSASAGEIHRKPDDPPPDTTKIPAGETVEIPLERLKRWPANDLIVGVFGTNLVALPLKGEAWTLAPATEVGTVAEPGPILTIPTVGKEGLVAVKVSGNVAFLIDAGGEQAVVSPTALAEIQSALGVTSIKGTVITHVHKDHIQSLVEIVKAAQIRPENLHFAEAFENILNPYLNALRNDASLQPLGYSATASFTKIATPTTGTFFSSTQVEGEMQFDYYGLTGPMRTLSAARTAGGLGKTADTGSL